MSGVRKWLTVETGPFHFGTVGPPLEVTVHHRIMKPGPNGPIQTGEVVRLLRNGELVREERHGSEAIP